MKEPFLSDAKASPPPKINRLYHLLFSVGAVAAVILLGNWLYTVVPHSPLNGVEGARTVQDFPALEREYLHLLDQNLHNIGYHRGRIDAHLGLTTSQGIASPTSRRDDSGVLNQYTDYTQSPLPNTRDIGYYGLGYYYARVNQPEKAFACFQKVSNPNLPYLNNSLGSLFMSWKKQPDRAREYFLREIALKGNLPGAVENLTQLYWNNHRAQELRNLAEDPVLGPMVPLHTLRYWYLSIGWLGDYLGCVFRTEIHGYTWMSLWASLVIALMFLVYIYYVDVFEKEQVRLLLGLFILGNFSAIFSTVAYDIAGCFFGFHIGGDAAQRLLSWVFGVGLIEETCKALPVLAAVYLWKKWDEPVDIFVFASVSALGFACLENAGYFTRMSITLILSRTLTAVVMHVSMTCLAFYGLFIHRYKPGAKNPVYIILFFGAAMAVHGLYDFFASGGLGLGVISTLILILMMMVFRNMLENALDQADFNYRGPLKLTLAGYLFYGLLGILLMQFAILDVNYGPDFSLANLGKNVTRLYLLFIILITDFGHLKIVKHQWRPLLDRKNE
jgi:RsiW-degrading membrane proteinase PrsW (M82 family)